MPLLPSLQPSCLNLSGQDLLFAKMGGCSGARMTTKYKKKMKHLFGITGDLALNKDKLAIILKHIVPHAVLLAIKYNKLLPSLYAKNQFSQVGYSISIPIFLFLYNLYHLKQVLN